MCGHILAPSSEHLQYTARAVTSTVISSRSSSTFIHRVHVTDKNPSVFIDMGILR